MLLAKVANVLIIVWADVGWTDVAPHTPTPTLVSFASEGVGLRTCITQPIGSHTFYSVVFGEYAVRNGNRVGFSWWGDQATRPDVPLDKLSLPEAAKAAGYRVALHGKWGLGGNDIGDSNVLVPSTPYLHGFSEWRAGIAVNVDRGPGDSYYNWERTDDAVVTMSTEYADLAIKNEWVSWWLGEPGPKLSVVWFEGAHGPWTDLPPSEALPAWYVPDGSTARGRYEAMVVALDHLTGEMLSYVDLSDTLVFVLSTNGTPDRSSISPIPGRVKRTVFDTGIRNPAAVRGPGVARGVSEELVSPVDVWATIAELTDVAPPPAESDSVGFAPLLEDPTRRSRRRYAYSQHQEEAVRTLTHKLRKKANGKLELFDLVEDPGETTPLDPDDYEDRELVANLRYWLANPGSGMVVDRR
jgi:arylsulfatase A-like enzyme